MGQIREISTANCTRITENNRSPEILRGETLGLINAEPFQTQNKDHATRGSSTLLFALLIASICVHLRLRFLFVVRSRGLGDAIR